MIPFGLVRNPSSLRNRSSKDGFRRNASEARGNLFAESQSRDDLPAILRDFARREVGLLAIDGGDGTVHKVLTALPDAFGENLPRLAILPSGNTNLIAADIGCKRRDTATFMRLMDIANGTAQPNHVHKRATLDIHWPDNAHAPVSGMFLGAAGFTRGIDLAHGRIYVNAVTHRAAVASAILASLGQACIGRSKWLAGDAMTIAPSVSGNPSADARSGNRFLFLATSLHRLIFGLWPFWNAGGAAINYLDIDAYPKHLLPALFAMLRGRSPQWLQDSPYYRSGGADTIQLELRHRFVLDGECFDPGPSGKIELRAGRVLDFVAI